MNALRYARKSLIFFLFSYTIIIDSMRFPYTRIAFKYKAGRSACSVVNHGNELDQI